MMAVRDDQYFFIGDFDALERSRKLITSLLCSSSIPLSSDNEPFNGFVFEVPEDDTVTYAPNLDPFKDYNVKNVGFNIECSIAIDFVLTCSDNDFIYPWNKIDEIKGQTFRFTQEMSKVSCESLNFRIRGISSNEGLCNFKIFDADEDWTFFEASTLSDELYLK
jgi:hypothetical protein